jgi:hypothetical protein
MKTFANWRSVGRAMLEARRRQGVVVDAKTVVGLAAVTDIRWRFLDRAVITMVIATHAVGYDRTDVEISRRDAKLTFYGVSDAAEILRVLAALDLIPADLAEVRDERYARCVCKRVLFWRPETPELPARWRHLDRRAYIEHGLHRAEVAE